MFSDTLLTADAHDGTYAYAHLKKNKKKKRPDQHECFLYKLWVNKIPQMLNHPSFMLFMARAQMGNTFFPHSIQLQGGIE